MWYERHLQTRLASLSGQFSAVLLTGARQTGKTALLRRAFPDRSFVSLDLPSAAEEAEHRPKDFLGRYPPPVTIDEVQYAPRLFRSLKIAVDERRSERGLFLLTGSQKFHLMESLSESLAGRCAFLELHTLSAAEFSPGRQLAGEESLSFLFRGGYPELCADASISAGDFYRGYVATYLERDVRNLVQVGSLRDFERFLRLAATRCGALLNLSELGRDVGVATSTASTWVSVLQASGIVLLLEPYFENFGKRLIKTPKLYFLDTGLLCFLLGISSVEALLASPFPGQVWESYVLGQIVRDLERRGSATTVWFWRDAHGLEVDFLLDEGSAFSLVEAKWSEQPAKVDVEKIGTLARFLSAKREVRSYLACRTPNRYPIVPGVDAVNPFAEVEWIHP